tara:strand:+ start:60 stop:341 length:282 start_codon:yes stop_codon:yes gene_type:complete
MQLDDLKWVIIRAIGLCLLCISIYQINNLIEVILRFNYLDANQYSEQWDYTKVRREMKLVLIELFILSGMSYYFLKKGKATFNLLSKKETSND